MPHHINMPVPRCPGCNSSWFQRRPRLGQLCCKACNRLWNEVELVAEAKAVPVKKNSGSGQIAGLTYRQQIARRILAENEQNGTRTRAALVKSYYGKP